jgi:hypothetical protein
MSRTSRLAVLSALALLLSFSFVSVAADKDAKGWKSLFDGKSLRGWKRADYGPVGKVEAKAGTIMLGKGKKMTGVFYSGGDFPKTDYEVTLQAKKIDGEDFFCTTTFPVGKTFCSFVVGGWGGTVVGLSSINGSDASENETLKTHDFTPGQWYRVRIRVTDKKIEAWIDEEKMVDLKTAKLKISIRIECEACRPFGIATYNTSAALRDIRVRKLSDGK